MAPPNVNQARWPLLTALIALAGLVGFGAIDFVYAGQTDGMVVAIVALVGLIAAALAWRALSMPTNLASSDRPAHDTAPREPS